MASEQKRMRISSRQRGPLAKAPELWEQLDDGRSLRTALEAFYTRVFQDPRLAPFFAHVTKERVIGKQFEFLRDIFTGRRDYIGLEPRNAHHWMVIDEELFDYREELMELELRRAGVPDKVIDKVRLIDEVYRKQIVKDAPVPMICDGVVFHMEGYDQLTVELTCNCDGCGLELFPGDAAYCHRRTGAGLCPSCWAQQEQGQRSA